MIYFLAVEFPKLFAVNQQGQVRNVDTGDFEGNFANEIQPSWVSHASGIMTFFTSPGANDYTEQLYQGIFQDAGSQFMLTNINILSVEIVSSGDGYAWSPTGHWVAVRHSDYQGGDHVFLLNPTAPNPNAPSQQVTIVDADRVGQQMANPIWSPDGKTIIVFGVNDNQPYSLDIASFLKSKGLSL